MEISADNLEYIINLSSTLNHIPINGISGKLYIGGRCALNIHTTFNIHHLITLFDFDKKILNTHHDIYDIHDTQIQEDVKIFEKHLGSISQSIHKSLSEGKNVCVHCKAGISRSATVIADYLLTFQETDSQTLRYIKSFRPIINPNPSFVELLERRHNIKLDW